MGNIKRRLSNLENDQGDDKIQVIVCWCEPGKCTCPPADKVVTFDDDNQDLGDHDKKDN